VKKPNEDDWKKLHCLLRCINGTRKDKLILSADRHGIKWYIDATFAVHLDFKSHTGVNMTYGQGTPMSLSRKQKLNTRSSSTEAKLVRPNDLSTLTLWTRLFMQCQGYDIDKNILFQDNKSTILLEQNGKRSSRKRTRALNIRYLFLTGQTVKGNLIVKYYPTTEMVADYFSKPFQG
jgi:hypothetical protein